MLPNGTIGYTQNINCLDVKTWIANLSITTISMAVTRHTSTAVYSVLEDTILSVSNVSRGNAVAIEPRELLSCYNTTFNDPINTNEMALGTQVLIQSAGWGLGAFRSIDVALERLLASVFLFFQPRHQHWFRGNGTLPTACDFGKPVSRIILEKWTFIVFTLLSVSAYILCLCGLSWALRQVSPPITQFPLLDFSLRIASGAKSVQKILSEAALRDSLRISLQDKVLFLGRLVQMDSELKSRAQSISSRGGDHDAGGIVDDERRPITGRVPSGKEQDNSIRQGKQPGVFGTSIILNNDRYDPVESIEMCSPSQAGNVSTGEIQRIGFGLEAKDVSCLN